MPVSEKHVEIIAKENNLGRGQVARTLALIDGGATVPFVSRYRKEATGNLDEVQIGAIADRETVLRELDDRKATVLREIERQGKLTAELKTRIETTLSKTALEDLYLPYKPKRRTRATVAREKGLQPLAERILAQTDTEPAREQLAAPYISAERGIPDVETAFAGARDIVAEFIAENVEVRAVLREFAFNTGVFFSKVIKGKEAEGAKFRDYFEFREPAKGIPSHRMLAIRRGEKEKVLRFILEVEEERAIALIRERIVVNPRAAHRSELQQAIEDAYHRLLKIAIEGDVRNRVRERAENEAIAIFAENLRHLLLAPPLGAKSILGVDPGYRTGCKVVAVDQKGDLKEHAVIFPIQSDGRVEEAASTVQRLCQKHRVEAVAIGNGTASRETESFFRRLVKKDKLGGARIVLVNESGASVYSASEIARQELPDQDVTVRGAVSIGRRLQDPLAELVKIDPKSIGVGQYQHDVNQTTLQKALDSVVESCVNRIGVDLNTASFTLLRYVAGLGETLARNIVAFRTDNGPFRSRRKLLEVPRVGPKAYEQAAGFLRVRGGDNPLDDSAVHPESYDVVERMARDLGVEPKTLVGNSGLVNRIVVDRYVDEQRGLPTLRDIVSELERPGRDPRAEFEEAGFNPEITEFEQVKEGMVFNGVVTNVTQFGAFVDIGVHQDGLVHVSELAHRFVRDPKEIVRVGERVKVKVVQIDESRRRIGLSIKQTTEPPAGVLHKPETARTEATRSRAERERNAPRRTDAPLNNPFVNAFSKPNARDKNLKTKK